MDGRTRERLRAELAEIEAAGTLKRERPITSPQSAHVRTGEREVLNFCANNYLGLADHPRVVEAAHRALDERGFGMSSVRFICGTQDLHLELERRTSELLGTEATILFSSCFDANGGVFEALLGPEDAVISDALNHASLIDGIRLCKAARHRYPNRDMEALEQVLEGTQDARTRLVVTDGVFSMDGYLAPLREICELAERYDALVMVDDSHATGVLGPTGAGTPELLGVSDRVDIWTGTYGKALGGASGGFVSGRAEVVELLRQKARPYLFSNTIAPVVVAGTLAALDLLAESGELREELHANAHLFRTLMTEAGFEVLPGEHPIVPVMFGDAALAARVAERMLEDGVYVVAFSYPVVPRGQARIRVQLSAAHTRDDVERAVAAFVRARDAELGS